ncbi:MAG: Sensor protein [uncultured bacterium]|nr:MAG: Sensor protein [uncultured bacterium]
MSDSMTNVRSSYNQFREAFVVLMLVLFPVIIAAVQGLSFFSNVYGPNEQLHSALEMLGAVVCLFVATLLSKRDRLDQTEHFLPLALALACMGILDAFHSVAGTVDGAALLRLASSFFGAMIFGLFWFPRVDGFMRKNHWFFLLVVALACSLGCLVVVFADRFPGFYETGFIAWIRRPHYLVGLLFLIIAIKLAGEFQRTNSFQSFLLLCLSLLFSLTELAFKPFMVGCVSWWFWHGVRLLAYLAMLRFVISDYQTLVDRLGAAIIQHQKTEAEIRREHAQLISIFDSMDQPIYIIDPELYQILYVNEAAKKLFGNAEGKPCHVVLHNKDNPCEFCTNDKIFGNNFGKTHVWEFYNEHIGMWFRNIDKAIHWSDGRKVRFEMAVNIDDVKRAEEAIKQTADIKSKFISMASHELRTPLTTIQESVSVVLDGIAGDINDKQTHMLTITKKNIQRLSRLVDDILDFQKLQSGKMPFELKECDIDQLLLEVCRPLEKTANQNKLYLKYSFSKNLPLVLCDPDRIVQVVTNLVNNALKFVNRGGVMIETRQGTGFVQITVSDTGSGIKKEDMPKLFQTFEQLRTSDSAVTKGTGLGLVICKEIIQGHQGKIWIESEYGRGTSVHFTLPVYEEMKERITKGS